MDIDHIQLNTTDLPKLHGCMSAEDREERRFYWAIIVSDMDKQLKSCAAIVISGSLMGERRAHIAACAGPGMLKVGDRRLTYIARS